ncbi:unnamed protein product, partial [Gadus morhua 'NCC']
MASSQFEHPKIDWDASDLYQEFSRFRSHVTFVFEGPLSDLAPKQQAGWLGELQRSETVLRSYSNHRLKLVAAVNLQVKSKKCKETTVFEILDIAQENVLSGASAEALGLIVRLDLLESDAERRYTRNPDNTETQRVPAGLLEFPELTRTTGTMP